MKQSADNLAGGRHECVTISGQSKLPIDRDTHIQVRYGLRILNPSHFNLHVANT